MRGPVLPRIGMPHSLLVETKLLPAGESTELWVSSGRFVAGPLDDAVGASARAHLEAGVLTVREPGSPNRASAGIERSEGLPTVITAGRFLAPPGRYFPGLAREVDDGGLLTAAREELIHSGGWVKVIGDFFDDSGRFSTNYRLETLQETARDIHSAGGRVTMHAMAPDSIQQAIDAGFDGVEHGSVLTAGQVEAMAAAGMTWTPTALIDDNPPRHRGVHAGPLRSRLAAGRSR